MDNKTKISNYINSIISKDRIQKDQEQKLDDFINDFSTNESIEEYFQENWNMADADADAPKMLNEIKRNSNIKNSIIINTVWFQRIFAASVLLLLCAGTFYYIINTKEEEKIAYNTVVGVPPSDKVVLKKGGEEIQLSNQIVDISSAHAKVQGNDEALNIEILKDDVLTSVEWSTLVVPQFKTYFISLSDGTKVWLNASSEIKFPDRFVNGQREVFVKGEVYFEVESDINNPFIVHTHNALVEVTGTKFNVNCYRDEPNAITLLEGKVAVSVRDKKYDILPGEQLLTRNIGDCAILKVDAAQNAMWKDGIYEFNNMPIKDLALRLERWYDVQFQFENSTIANECYSGMVKKEYDIEYFIRVLEKTSNHKFTLQGSKIVVRKE